MRFRLKTDFLTYARDQIRGGLWYKPAWWDAVRKVPPTSFVPRIKKRDIPRISFVEDRLARDFEATNPAIAQIDRYFSARKDPRTVAGIFAAEQVRAMQKDKTEAEAYALAKTWLLERGPETLQRLGVLVDEKSAASLEAHAYSDTMAKQAKAMRQALREDLIARQSHRLFVDSKVQMLAQRGLSGEPVFQHVDEPEMEAAAVATVVEKPPAAAARATTPVAVTSSGKHTGKPPR